MAELDTQPDVEENGAETYFMPRHDIIATHDLRLRGKCCLLDDPYTSPPPPF
jgi:hypothetical protein